MPARENAPLDDLARVPTTAEAGRLRACLAAAGYTEAAVCERLGIGSVVAIEPLHAAYYQRRLRDSGPQGALIRLFLLQRPALASELEPVFGPGDRALMAELGLVERQDETLIAQVDLYPYGSDWLVTDRSDRAGEGAPGGRPDAVMPLNMSSHLLAQLVLPAPGGLVLDVGTGCGVHAIRAARQARQVIATDLNPRALQFAAFNAVLNDVQNLELRQGSVWEPVKGERFDRILANPAFSLSARTDFLYRDGGARGDRMTAALLEGAAEQLRDSGIAQVIGEFPTIGDEGFEEQVERWLGEAPCDRLLLRFGAMEPLEYAVAYAHQPFEQRQEIYEAELAERLDSLEQLEIWDVVLGGVLLRRAARGTAGRPCWRAHRVLPAPEQPLGPAIQALIAAMDRWEPDAGGAGRSARERLWEGVPRLVEGVRLTQAQIWRKDHWDPEETRVRVVGNPLCHDLRLSEAAGELLTRCDGQRRGAEIAAEFAGLYELEGGEAAEATVAFLQELAEQGLIELDEKLDEREEGETPAG